MVLGLWPSWLECSFQSGLLVLYVREPGNFSWPTQARATLALRFQAFAGPPQRACGTIWASTSACGHSLTLRRQRKNPGLSDRNQHGIELEQCSMQFKTDRTFAGRNAGPSSCRSPARFSLVLFRQQLNELLVPRRQHNHLISWTRFAETPKPKRPLRKYPNTKANMTRCSARMLKHAWPQEQLTGIGFEVFRFVDFGLCRGGQPRKAKILVKFQEALVLKKMQMPAVLVCVCVC